MKNKIFIFSQYLIPQHFLSRCMGFLSECRWKWLKNFLISCFIWRYKVDLSLALVEDITAYPSFNAFFTRALKDTVRPISSQENTIISPVDGCISQIGSLAKKNLLQAKGSYFSVDTLLGG